MGLWILTFLAMTGAALYLRKRLSPPVFASLAALAGLGIYLLGVLYLDRWHDAQLARDRIVDGKGLFDSFFFLSAFAGVWIGSATATLVANASPVRDKPIVKTVSAAASFLSALIAAIPTGVYLGFTIVR
ncbi:MAG TPA: hypothetical protein VIN61_03920 [Gammaproteobacteria bacterium]